MAMKPLQDCLLYTFLDLAYLRERDPKTLVQQLCDGGSDLIQLRAKGRAPEEIRRLAETILPLTNRAGVGLVINDHLEIAKDLGAPFCHLGQEDFFDAGHTHISELLSENDSSQIGLSSHAPDQARRAVTAGAAYVAIGPVYPTGTKPAAKPVTLEHVRWAVANVQIPWFAIGGINLATIDAVLNAGARRVCVVSAILNRDDVAQACREFRNRLK
jgi:thiamine-phosphate pyrophosphorylase